MMTQTLTSAPSHTERYLAAVDAHQHLVYAAARRQLENPLDAEDATQAVFLLFLKKLPTLPKDRPLAPWLLTATRYICQDAKKRARRRLYHERRVAMPADQPTTPDHAHLDDALASLSRTERDALTLRYLQQLDIPSVAAALNLNELTVKKRLTRGLANLRAYFAIKNIDLSTLAVTTLLTHTTNIHAPTHLTATLTTLTTKTATAGALTMSHAATQKLLLASLKPAALLIAAIALSTATVFIVHRKTDASPAELSETISPYLPALPPTTQPTPRESAALAAVIAHLHAINNLTVDFETTTENINIPEIPHSTGKKGDFEFGGFRKGIVQDYDATFHYLNNQARLETHATQSMKDAVPTTHEPIIYHQLTCIRDNRVEDINWQMTIDRDNRIYIGKNGAGGISNRVQETLTLWYIDTALGLRAALTYNWAMEHSLAAGQLSFTPEGLFQITSPAPGGAVYIWHFDPRFDYVMVDYTLTFPEGSREGCTTADIRKVQNTYVPFTLTETVEWIDKKTNAWQPMQRHTMTLTKATLGDPENLKPDAFLINWQANSSAYDSRVNKPFFIGDKDTTLTDADITALIKKQEDRERDNKGWQNLRQEVPSDNLP